MQSKSDSKLSKILRFLKKLFIVMFVAQLVYIVILKWMDPPVTITQVVSLVSGDGLKRDYINFEDMSLNAKLSVLAVEDQAFPDHNGFDFKSIEKAMKHNSKSKKRRGASTISQQVAKNVFLWQGGGWFRKGLEVYFTFMIELVWGKERILEVYLNVAEMGKGVFGIEAAAKKFFKKSAKQLSKNEAAMIAASLRNPKVFTVKPLSKFVAARYPWVVKQATNLSGDKDIQKILK